MALDTYTNLSVALGAWDLRTYTTSETDEAILLAETKANRKLDQDFRRRSTSTVNTDASGVGTLPTGFVGLSSVTRNVLGSRPLRQVSNDAFVTLNPNEIGDDAQVFALLSATQFAVTPVTDDDFIFFFSGKVPALTSLNTTNWLLALAPDYYLHMGRAALAEYNEDYAKADRYEGRAVNILSEIVSQGNVAEYGNVEMTLDFVTP